MTELRLDQNGRKCLETYLDSFEKLEVVRALRASGHALSRSDLEAACRFTADTIHEVLGSLQRLRVVALDTEDGLVRLGSLAADPAFDAVMRLYENDRAAVLSTLSKISLERIRSMAARAFADAFVLRKKRDDGNG